MALQNTECAQTSAQDLELPPYERSKDNAACAKAVEWAPSRRGGSSSTADRYLFQPRLVWVSNIQHQDVADASVRVYVDGVTYSSCLEAGNGLQACTIFALHVKPYSQLSPLNAQQSACLAAVKRKDCTSRHYINEKPGNMPNSPGWLQCLAM